MADEEKRILGICGLGGGGKDTVVAMLEKKMGAKMMKFGNVVVQEEIRKDNKEITNKNMREYATEMRERFGLDVIAKRSLPMITEEIKSTKLLILNSIKALEEVDFLRRELPYRIELLAVHANARLRFERLAQRGMTWDMKDYKELEWRDRKELSWGLGSAISLSDYMIVNEGAREELEQSVDRLVAKLNK